MSNVVIVAIPDENDRVWKVSSEKVPHLTLLFLGDENEVSNLEQIVQFVEHAAKTTLKRFYLPVDRRDELGADPADVLFFKKGRYDFKAVRDFRATLLQDQNIRTAYDTATQHDGPWLPHLTLGYPATPAKPDDTDRDFGFYDVSFNKIAVWVGDFEGPEFLLKDYWDELEELDFPMDVAMSGLDAETVKAGMAVLDHSQDAQNTAAHGEVFVEGLMHFGTKGMKWGVRKAPPSAVAPTATSKVPHGTKRKTKIETDGGENHPAHSDAIKVAQARTKLAKSGPAALSNQELRDVANRVQLEQQVKQLVAPAGKKFVTNLLKNQGNQGANLLVNKKVTRRLVPAA